nr:hypothetical protein [Clostridium sp. Marseille-P7770]
MTLEKIIDEFKLQKLGVYILGKKDINLLKIKLFKYIDVYEYWYDNEDYPDDNTWIDVEGIGYGWIWSGSRLRRHSKLLQRRAIIEHAERLLKLLPENGDMIHYRLGDCYYYGFMIGDQCYVQIRVSDEELDLIV